MAYLLTRFFDKDGCDMGGWVLPFIRLRLRTWCAWNPRERLCGANGYHNVRVRKKVKLLPWRLRGGTPAYDTKTDRKQCDTPHVYLPVTDKAAQRESNCASRGQQSATFPSSLHWQPPLRIHP